LTPHDAIRIQDRIRKKVIARGRVSAPILVAGANAFDTEAERVFAGVVVLSEKGYRIPEPTRQADQLAEQARRASRFRLMASKRRTG
jgi:deoxyinosine 3'endonuclease (endonuclease V)